MKVRKKKFLTSSGIYKGIQQPIKAIYYHPHKTDTEHVSGCSKLEDALIVALDNIIRQKKESETVCIIGRYNIHKYKILNYHLEYIKEKERILYNKFPDIHINFLTIHKAKGIEFDYVIFLDMMEDSDKYSFPTQITDDYKIEPLLKKSESYPYAEERRMFYVALTRAKQFVYLLVSEDHPSCFFNEIKDHTEIINDTLAEYCKKTNQTICPECHNAILTSDDYHKFICRNCNFNCNDKGTIFTNIPCPLCHGKLCIRYNLKNNTYFIGCSNYYISHCKFTLSYDVFIRKYPNYASIISNINCDNLK